jgi:hypothetical protein
VSRESYSAGERISAEGRLSELPFPSVAFGVLFALFAARGSVATAERRLDDLVE